jgi:transposase
MSNKKGNGAPTKFNAERAERLIQAVRGGNYLETAARYAGISYHTLRRWLLKADEPDAPPEYVAFKEAILKARADAEVAALAKIQKAASEGAWQASAWYLERSWPERWGRRETNRVELVGDGGGPVKMVAGIELDDASMHALAQRLSSRTSSEENEIEEAEIIEDQGALDPGDPLGLPAETGPLD